MGYGQDRGQEGSGTPQKDAHFIDYSEYASSLLPQVGGDLPGLFSVLIDQLHRDLPDESRVRNADFALRYAERQYGKFRQRVPDNARLYVEAVVQHHLGNQPMDQEPLTEQKLQDCCDKLHLCQQIVINSVGIEDRWTKIEAYRCDTARLKRWISDVECEVLADSLEAAHRLRSLLYQK
jgi:hypothetical protein